MPSTFMTELQALKFAEEILLLEQVGLNTSFNAEEIKVAVADKLRQILDRHLYKNRTHCYVVENQGNSPGRIVAVCPTGDDAQRLVDTLRPEVFGWVHTPLIHTTADIVERIGELQYGGGS